MCSLWIAADDDDDDDDAWHSDAEDEEDVCGGGDDCRDVRVFQHTDAGALLLRQMVNHARSRNHVANFDSEIDFDENM